MSQAPIPANEQERLAALRALELLDSPAEAMFDHITALAAQICDTPIALISLVDAQRQWFKSRVGLDAEQTARELAFCAHAVAADAPLEVDNALDDARFRDNPLVTSAPHIRFYAGQPLITPEGVAIGTLSVVCTRPKPDGLDSLQREDGLHLPDGSVARDNAEMVRAAADIAAIYGLQPASVDEARARFGI